MKTAPRYTFALICSLALAGGCDEDPADFADLVPSQTAQPERADIDGDGAPSAPEGPESRVPDEPSTPVEDGETPTGPGEDVTPGEGPDEPAQPPVGGELTITRLEVPEDVLAQTHALSEASWILDRPAFGCETTTGVFVAANVYELVNESGGSADLRIGLRTGENGVSLTLPGATLYAYSSGVLPDSPHACTLIGEPTSSFASELSGITLAPGESIDFIVAGADHESLGTYQVTIIRADLDTAPDITPETEPEPTPDPEPRPDDPPGPSPEEGPGCSNECPYSGDGTCDDGGPGSTFSACALGTDCADCGVRDGGGGTVDPPAPSGDELCNDSCPLFASDGACDDGGPGSLFPLCDLGTDCTDCGPRAGGGTGGGVSCTDTCTYFADGDCDDGGPGSDYSFCDLGTDCFDCGPR